MNKNTFYQELRDFLEIESMDHLEGSTNLKTLQEYDSMMVMLIIAFVDQNFNKKLSAQQLANITTVDSLMDIIGKEEFK